MWRGGEACGAGPRRPQAAAPAILATCTSQVSPFIGFSLAQPGQGRLRSRVCSSISASEKAVQGFGVFWVVFFFVTNVTSPLGKGKLVCNYVIISHPEAQLMRSVTLPEKGEVCWMHGVNRNDGDFSLQLCFSLFLIALLRGHVKRAELSSVWVYICSSWPVLVCCASPDCAFAPALPV